MWGEKIDGRRKRKCVSVYVGGREGVREEDVKTGQRWEENGRWSERETQSAENEREEGRKRRP